LSFVDVAHMRRPSRSVGLSTSAQGIAALAWPRPHRVLALTTGINPIILAFDPVARRTIRRDHLHGIVEAESTTRVGLVVVLGNATRIGNARLVLAAAATTRQVTLTGIRAGRKKTGGGYAAASPRLALDSSHAFVSGYRVTADVPLPLLGVTYH